MMLPPVLHSQSYMVINNDTAAHLKAFETGHYIYGAQAIAGYVFGMFDVKDMTILFMLFNFAMLATAGMIVGLMVYRLTGSDIASLLAIGMITLGLNATMHLFYSGTIFNIIGVLILLPVAIIVSHWLATKKLYWIAGLMIIPMAVAFWYYHPALGGGLLASGQLKESVLNPLEAILVFYGIYNAILLIVSSVFLWKYETKGINRIIIVMLAIGIVASGVIGFAGLNPYPSRVIINMFLLLMLLTVLVMGIALQNTRGKHRALITGLGIISLIPGTYAWIMNSVIRGIPAGDILS